MLLPTTPEVIANTDAKPKPVKAGPKPAYAYIGGVDPDIDCNDIMFHINTFSNVKIKQGDVQIEPIRFGSNRSFKVAVPQEKLHEITQNKYLWEYGIKAAPYNKQRPKEFSNSRKQHPRKMNQTFQGSNLQSDSRAKPVKPGPRRSQYQPRHNQPSYNGYKSNKFKFNHSQSNQPEYGGYWR